MDENFQAAASHQGREFEDAVVSLLKFRGWSITGRRIIVHGVEIDITAQDPEGIQWWIECKGSWRGKTPGSKRGDTVKKAVGVAAFLATQTERCKYMLVTSHLPNPGTVGWRMLDAALRNGWFDEVRVAGLLLGMTDAPLDEITEDEAP
jgi:Holliday junction resolvase-like predicted endonuclease